MDFLDRSSLLATVGLVLSVISLLAINRGICYVSKSRTQRALFFSKTTPPLSSGEKAVSPRYKDDFPPSTRSAWASVMRTKSHTPPICSDCHATDEAQLRKNLLPFTGDYRQCGPSLYTPMQLSIAEIERLGDFPDYATLSGVPLPEAYSTFDINKALPRPYRPFRWAYHQTMCRFLML